MQRHPTSVRLNDEEIVCLKFLSKYYGNISDADVIRRVIVEKAREYQEKTMQQYTHTFFYADEDQARTGVEALSVIIGKELQYEPAADAGSVNPLKFSVSFKSKYKYNQKVSDSLIYAAPLMSHRINEEIPDHAPLDVSAYE